MNDLLVEQVLLEKLDDFYQKGESIAQEVYQNQASKVEEILKKFIGNEAVEVQESTKVQDSDAAIRQHLEYAEQLGMLWIFANTYGA